MTTKPLVSIGTVWTISEIDRRPWFGQATKPGKDCWPIRVMFFPFRKDRDEWICACQFDPVDDAVRAKSREIEATE